ncbi:MAG TPA: TIGR01777 family oxidoreductase [Thermoleophilaceae bacterium]
MRVALTGATGTIGSAVVGRLRARGDEAVVLTRDPDRARERLGGEVEAHRWAAPESEPAPADALAGCDGVVNLLGEPVDQRWTDAAKDRIRDSRVLGTRNLVAGLRAAEPRPRALVSGSASGWYGPRGDERVDETEPAADDFLARVVAAWEAEARAAGELGLRVALARTGVALSGSGGALARMLTPFRLGVGGPVAGGGQYVPWVHVDDVAGAILLCLDDDRASGPVNVSAPEPATNRELSKALGRVLRRPAVAPVPGLALRLLYGEMSSVVTTGVRMVPARLTELGYRFEHPELEEALRSATGRT